MMRTVAPKDLGGRLLRNLARTTPELPGRGKMLVNRYGKRARYAIALPLLGSRMLMQRERSCCCSDRVDAYREGG
jgi:hypothetical protein